MKLRQLLVPFAFLFSIGGQASQSPLDIKFTGKLNNYTTLANSQLTVEITSRCSKNVSDPLAGLFVGLLSLGKEKNLPIATARRVNCGVQKESFSVEPDGQYRVKISLNSSANTKLSLSVKTGVSTIVEYVYPLSVHPSSKTQKIISAFSQFSLYYFPGKNFSIDANAIETRRSGLGVSVKQSITSDRNGRINVHGHLQRKTSVGRSGSARIPPGYALFSGYHPRKPRGDLQVLAGKSSRSSEFFEPLLYRYNTPAHGSEDLVEALKRFPSHLKLAPLR